MVNTAPPLHQPSSNMYCPSPTTHTYRRLLGFYRVIPGYSTAKTKGWLLLSEAGVQFAKSYVGMKRLRSPISNNDETRDQAGPDRLRI